MSASKCWIGFVFLSLVSQPEWGQRIAFVDVTVVPMNQERVLPHHTVLVANGRILAVGRTGRMKLSRGTQAIDGRGKYLMPGLADMHVRIAAGAEAEAMSLLFLANGVTTVRNMFGSPEVLGLRKRIESGSVLGPRIYTTGPLNDGKPPVWAASRIVETASKAAEAVSQDKGEGYDAIKVYQRLSPEAYKALVSAAREYGLPVYGHVPESVGLGGVLEARQDSIEHLQGYVEALQAADSPYRAKIPKNRAEWTRLFDHVDLTKLPALVKATLSAGTWNCVTIVVSETAGTPPEQVAARLRHPAMKYVAPARLAQWQDRPKSFTTEDFARMRKRPELVRKITKALHDAGARILLGTDTQNPFVVPGFSIHEELQDLVDAGLTPYQAIKAGTRDAAEFLKSQGAFGIVAAGSRADLILLDANPLEEVRNANRRAGVMVRGRWLAAAELQARLERLATSYAKQ